DPQHAQAGVLGGLDDAGVPGRERGADRAPEYLHRIVPGNDVTSDPVRLAQGQDGVALAIGDGLAMELVRGSGVELEVARQRQGVGAGLAQWFAGVARLQRRELLGGVLDRPAQAGQEAPALGRGSSAPWTVGSAVAVEGAPGAGHGEADIGAATPGDRPEYRAVRRIDDLEPVAIERGARYVVDEEAALDDFGTIGGHGGARA